MTTFPLFSGRVSKWIAVVFGAALVAVAPVFADDDPGPPSLGVNVVYNPDATQTVQGDEPLHFEYVLSITSPEVLPAGSYSVAVNTAVISAPAGVSEATAQTFISLSQPVLVFTGPKQTQQVTVQLNVAIGASTGDFGYKLSTSGWPTDLGITDAGTFINMHVDPASGLEPPTVSIVSPLDGAIYTYVVGGPAVSVPVEVVGAASQSAPVLDLTAVLSGVDENGNQIYSGVDGAGQPIHSIPISLLTTNLGTPTGKGQATLALTISGHYHIAATATNALGSADTSIDFVVNEQVPPPTVVINPPSGNPSYSYVRGVSSTTVPYTFVATSRKGGIQTITATLDGNPLPGVTLSPLGVLQVTGTGALLFDASVLNAPGQHVIAVTATDPYGSASTSATFVVVERVPQIATHITAPVNGLTVTMPQDASPLNLPFSFSSSVTLGGTVEVISATLTKGTSTIPLTLTSTSGLNTAVATGAGTLLNLAPGTYTLSAVGSNNDLGLSASDSVTFTVLPPPPPEIVFTLSPQPNYSTVVGGSLSIPFAIQTSSTGAYISLQSVMLDGAPVAGLTSTANGTALTATGGATLSIAAPAAGTTSYTLVATGTDVYGQIDTAQVAFTVQVTEPEIAIAINPQIVANSPYTMPVSGPLAIPFTFTGTITSGATVDTIVGSLNGTPVTFTSSSGLGTSATATASGTLTISEPGTYTVTATDTNAASGISATTSVSFEVKASDVTPEIVGCVFFDVNLNGTRDPDEYGMPGVTVKLLTSAGQAVETTTSDADGRYSFKPATGSYTVSAGAQSGFSFTTAADHAVTLAEAHVDVPDTGYGLNFASISAMSADGFTIGYWKNNIDKALSGKKNGTQVSAATLASYTAVIGNLALSPLDGLTMQAASAKMGANSSAPASLLEKQLVASEYNYATGAFIGGNGALTYAFIYYAEYVLAHSSSYSSTYLIFVKDWCDAYNNSHGGKVKGPQP